MFGIIEQYLRVIFGRFEMLGTRIVAGAAGSIGFAVAGIFLLIPGVLGADENCSEIASDSVRLACYDAREAGNTSASGADEIFKEFRELVRYDNYDASRRTRAVVDAGFDDCVFYFREIKQQHKLGDRSAFSSNIQQYLFNLRDVDTSKFRRDGPYLYVVMDRDREGFSSFSYGRSEGTWSFEINDPSKWSNLVHRKSDLSQRFPFTRLEHHRVRPGRNVEVNFVAYYPEDKREIQDKFIELAEACQ